MYTNSNMEANFEQLKFACSWLFSLCYFYYFLLILILDYMYVNTV